MKCVYFDWKLLLSFITHLSIISYFRWDFYFKFVKIAIGEGYVVDHWLAPSSFNKHHLHRNMQKKLNFELQVSFLLVQAFSFFIMTIRNTVLILRNLSLIGTSKLLKSFMYWRSIRIEVLSNRESVINCERWHIFRIFHPLLRRWGYSHGFNSQPTYQRRVTNIW